MKPGSLNICLYGRRALSLTVLGVFLLLGFCPVRNMLCHMAQPDPARNAQPAPEYAKITSGEECAVFTAVAQHVTQAGYSTGTGFDFTVSCRAVFVLVPEKVPVTYFSAVPLYLRNCALRI